MDLKTVQTELRRLASLAEGWRQPQDIAAIERDLMLARLRDLYEAVAFGLTVDAAPQETAKEAPVPAEVPTPTKTAPSQPQEQPLSEIATQIVVPPVVTEPAPEAETAAAPEPEPAVAVPEQPVTAPTLFGETELVRHRRKQRVIMSLYDAPIDLPAPSKPVREEEPVNVRNSEPIDLERFTIGSIDALLADTPAEAPAEAPVEPIVEPIEVPAAPAEVQSEPSAVSETETVAEESVPAEENTPTEEPVEMPPVEADPAAAEEPVSVDLPETAPEPVDETEAVVSEDTAEEAEPFVETAAEAPAEVFVEEPVEIPAEAPAKTAAEEPAEVPAESVAEIPAGPAVEMPAEISDATPVASVGASDPVPVLGEVIAPHVQTLAEKLAPAREVAADRLRNEPISDLRHAVGINDKFLLIRDLFDGNGALYEITIRRLNEFDNFDDCMIYIAEHFAWNPNSDGAKLMMGLLERKFA